MESQVALEIEVLGLLCMDDLLKLLNITGKNREY